VLSVALQSVFYLRREEREEWFRKLPKGKWRRFDLQRREVEYRDKETRGEEFHKADLHIHYPRLSDDASALMGAPTVLALAQLMRGVFYQQRVAARGEVTINGGIIPTEGIDESNSITIEDIDVLLYAKGCGKIVSSVEMDLHGVTDVKEMLQYAYGLRRVE
jgi:hypothetical protein